MAKGVKKTPAHKKKSNKGYKKPPPIRTGEVVTDQCYRAWKIGSSIGVGGFGEIYSACEVGDESSYPYVVKFEPIENGPLFVEEHFYCKNYSRDFIKNFMKSKNLSHLGMPVFMGKGETTYEGTKLRFLVLERYGRDISKIFKEAGMFPAPTVFQLGLQVLDVLEYIHGRNYIHADIKGANILMGIKKGEENQVFLVDYGLAYRLVGDNYRPNPTNAHEGTLEYTSRDRHIGAQTMRGDLEILAYNMLHWLVGELSWEKIVDPVTIHQMKNRLMNHVRDRITCDYPNVPEELIQFFEYINNLNLNDMPNYTICRRIFEGYLASVGKTRTSKLEFTLASDNAEISAVNKAIDDLKLNNDENNCKEQHTKIISEIKEKSTSDKNKKSGEDTNSTITKINRYLSKQKEQKNYSMSAEPQTSQCKREVVILTDIKNEYDKIQKVLKNGKSWNQLLDNNEVTKNKNIKKKKDKNPSVDEIHNVEVTEIFEELNNQNVSKKNEKRKYSDTVLPEVVVNKLAENTLHKGSSENEFLVKIKNRIFYNWEPSETNLKTKNSKVTSTNSDTESDLSLVIVSEEKTDKKSDVTLTENADVYELPANNKFTKKRKKDKNPPGNKIHNVEAIEIFEELKDQNVSKKNKKKKYSDTILPEVILNKLEENESSSEDEFLDKIKNRKFYNWKPSETNLKNKNSKVTSTNSDTESKLSLVTVSDENTEKTADVTITEDADVYELPDNNEVTTKKKFKKKKDKNPPLNEIHNVEPIEPLKN